MSWYIKSIGKKAAVIAAVNANNGISDALKSAIAGIVLDPSETRECVRVEGSGHGAQVVKLEIDPFQMAEEPKPVEAPAPAAEAAPAAAAGEQADTAAAPGA